MNHRRTTAPLIAAGLAAVYFTPFAPVIFARGLSWPVASQHLEALSLTTYGRWWLLPPHQFLTDAFSGVLPTFYNFVSDTLINLIALAGDWPPMTIQLAVYGPLLGFLIVWLGYVSLLPILHDRRQAAIASALVGLGVGSGLHLVFQHTRSQNLDNVLHVPFHALPLGTAQSLGWVLFLPCVASLYLARERNTTASIVAMGVSLGVLFNTHTLTFINVAFIHLAYLAYRNYTDAPRDLRWKLFMLINACAAVAFVIGAAAPRPLPLSFLLALWLAAMGACLIADPNKKLYLLGYGVAAFLAVPYGLALMPHAASFMALSEARHDQSVELPAIFLFFAPFWIGAAYAWRYSRSNPVVRWATVMVLANMFLGFNHLWNWHNHPYRFTIHLLFPLSVLLTVGLTHAHRWLRCAVYLWLLVTILANVALYVTGSRRYVNFEVYSEERTGFLRNVDRATRTSASDTWLLTAPEFEYPQGVSRAAALLNFSRIPAFLPDYRYQLALERYANRLALFCYLFPAFPAFDLHNGRRGCSEALDPPETFARVLSPALKNGALISSGIRWVASLDGPFDPMLMQTAAALGWSPLAEATNAHLFDITNVIELDGVARLGRGAYQNDAYELSFRPARPGPHLVVVGGRALRHAASTPLVNGTLLQELQRNEKPANWAIYRADLGEGEHQLRVPGASPDCIYFIAIIHEESAATHLALD
jgi:hypothetical protein